MKHAMIVMNLRNLNPEKYQAYALDHQLHSKEKRFMKKLMSVLLVLSMLFTVSASVADGNGEPHGDSDGIISREKLEGLYLWIATMEKSFKMQLNFDDIGNAVGKAGHDRGEGNEKYHAAHWTDESERYYVVITFYHNDENDTWWPGSVTTGLPELDSANLLLYPMIGNREAGSSPTEQVTMDAQISGTKRKFTVTADVPTENWYAKSSGGGAYIYLHSGEEDFQYSFSNISVNFLSSMDAWKEDIAKAEEFTETDGITCGDLLLSGCKYKKYSTRITEYYAEIPELDAVVRVMVKDLNLIPGSEAVAILNSLTFAEAE